MPKTIVISIIVGLVLGVTAFLLALLILPRGAPNVPGSPAPEGDTTPEVGSHIPQEEAGRPDLPFEIRESPAQASHPEILEMLDASVRPKKSEDVPDSDGESAPLNGMGSKGARQPTGENLRPIEIEVADVSPQMPHLPTPTQMAKLAVRSHPRAKVFVDGEYRGLTPLDLDLPVGFHVVLLRTVAPPEDEFTTTVELSPSQAKVIEQDFVSGWWRFH